MKKLQLFSALALLILPFCMNAESNDHPLSIDIEEQFLNYLDTINKYMYRNTQIVDEKMLQCENILNNSATISDSALVGYVVQKAYYEHSNESPLNAFQVLNDHKYLLQNQAISDKSKSNYNYILGFTYMALGDFESAQKIAYQNLKRGRLKKDTALIANSLYSVGQLYADQKEYEDAIKTFLEIIELEKQFPIRASTKTLTDYELAETYLRHNQPKLALEVINRALIFLDSEKLTLLKPDFLIFKSQIALEAGNIKEAERQYEIVADLAKNSSDPLTLKNSNTLLAEMLQYKKQYQKAFEINQTLLSKADSSDLENQLICYAKLHELSNLMNKPTDAYNYLLKRNSIKEKLDNEAKRQKTSYLKVKFESEKRIAENEILSLKILEEQNQNKLLFITLTLSIFGILALFWAFHQKRKYNKSLEAEVDKRTNELELTNTELNKKNVELDEFIRILSHDLKEPLRSIVGFSQLAKNEANLSKHVADCLGFIERSGKQLNQIIRDISTYQDINVKSLEAPKQIDTHELANTIANELKKDKQIQINCLELPQIYSNNSVLNLTFKILIQNAITFNKNVIPEVSIQYMEKENFHQFSFTDNGLGIDPKFHDTVFKLFKRLHNRKDYQGSGLGLSIAKNMIEKIGGNIHLIQSNTDQGSTFAIQIPIIEFQHQASIIKEKVLEVL